MKQKTNSKLYILPVVFLIALFSLAIATNAVKIVYDDWESGSINTSKWTGGGVVSDWARSDSTGTKSLLMNGAPIVNASSLFTNLDTNQFVIEWHWYANSTTPNNMQTSIGFLTINKGTTVSGFWSVDNGTGFENTGIATTSGKGDVENDWMRNRFLVDLDTTPISISWYMGNETTPSITTGIAEFDRLRYSALFPTYYVGDIVLFDTSTHDINGDPIIPQIPVYLNGTAIDIVIKSNETPYSVFHLENTSTVLTRNGTPISNNSMESAIGFFNYTAVQPETGARGTSTADVLEVIQTTTTLFINGVSSNINDIFETVNYTISAIGSGAVTITQNGTPIANNTILTSLPVGVHSFTSSVPGGELALGSSDTHTITITPVPPDPVDQLDDFAGSLINFGFVVVILMVIFFSLRRQKK